MTNANNATLTFLFNRYTLSCNRNSAQKQKKNKKKTFSYLEQHLSPSLRWRFQINRSKFTRTHISLICQLKMQRTKLYQSNTFYFFLIERCALLIFIFSSFCLSSHVRFNECNYVQYIWRDGKTKSIKKCHKIDGNDGACAGSSIARTIFSFYFLVCLFLSVSFIHIYACAIQLGAGNTKK